MAPDATSGAPGPRLVFAPGTRRLEPGLLCGGSPWRHLRLSAAGDAWIDRWRAGQPVPPQPGPSALAARLVDGGLASVRPAPDPHPSVTVVVPCRDRTAGLRTTLATLAADLDVVVVDDGSIDAVGTAEAAGRRPGTRLQRRERNGGPAAARNEGWRHAAPGGDRDLVAFIDTECAAPPGWLSELCGHFRDPAVGAVAPRIGTATDHAPPGWLQRYEQVRSPLDLGPLPATVRPRSAVPYVPSTALVVRRAALVELGGFDERLRTGEDVDLVWRLDRGGWKVRYDPSVVVTHPARSGLWAWAAQRSGYGRSAAGLASRHGRAVAPLSIPRWSAAAWLLTGLGHVVPAATIAAVAARRVARRAAPAAGPRARWEVGRAALRGHLRAGTGLSDALRRTWWPLAVLTAVSSRRARPALAAVVVVPPLREWWRRHPPLSPLAWVGLRLLDDLAYGAGVWVGVWQERRAGCLAPELS